MKFGIVIINFVLREIFGIVLFFIIIGFVS